MLNGGKLGSWSEWQRYGFVQLLADKNQTALTKMKKLILAAIALVGVGVATSRADVSFGVAFDNGYNSGRSYGPAPCAPAPVYVQPSYGYQDRDPAYAYRSEPREALRSESWEAHHDLHQDVREAKRALDRSIQRDKEALHQEMGRQRAAGVPSYVRKAEHDTAYRQLADAHHAGHAALEAAHREGHYDLGW
jgi:hypothetical protein